MAATSASSRSPFLITSVAVSQPRISASRRPGRETPARFSAAMAVANSLSVPRGGSSSPRVIATTPPGASRPMYAPKASTVYSVLAREARTPAPAGDSGWASEIRS